ncbi:MAG: AMIN domain-containing protein [Armatimonadota bacterium]|nr:AMIN domain-containing protein [Armatimonadota bacterium]MDR7519436.1 AMIN domain-containing protein [Armatimonadota bacterium]MDR7549874.1 AMIN domain-containing protein [Armatimonadota bacterium]
MAPALPQAEGLRVTQVTVKVFGDTVQLAVTATGPLTYRTLQLSAPTRLIIDLPGAVLDAAVPPLIDVDRGGIARVRTGQLQVNPAIARIAVDLVTPVPFTLTTSTPSVLVAKFTARPAVAAPAQVPPPVTPAVPAPVAQAPPPVPQAAPAATLAQAQPPTPSRITLEFRNTELADVLSALAKVCNLNIVTDASVKGQVTVRLVELTCDEALRFILEANNLGFRRIGRNLIIMAADKLAPPPEVPESVTYPIGFGTAKDVADAIRAAVPGVRVTHDVRSNAVVVVGTQAQHEEVRKILASLDIALVQIMIETRVVDVSMSDLQNLGLNWGLTAVPVIRVTGTGPTAPAPPGETIGQIVVGIHGSLNIVAALDALVTQRKARVITAPRVAAIDGNEAQVNLGEEVPIPSIDSAGRLTFTFKPIGVILRILPKVNRDGIITTKVEPEVSSVIEFLPTSSGPVPRIATRKATTTVSVRNGESIILAGLISAEERRTTIKVPLLGDIPIIGSLFRTTTTDRRESEVIFVVTPQLIPAAGGPAPAPSPSPRP